MKLTKVLAVTAAVAMTATFAVADGHSDGPNIFVIGDLAHYHHGGERPLPGLAPVAMQQGRYVARVIRRRFEGKTTPPFRYLDKGNMATIGRKKAVAELRGMRFAGLPAWLAWLFIHLLYLAAFENRVLVVVQWGWNYFTRNRSARLITAEPTEYDSETGVTDGLGGGRDF